MSYTGIDTPIQRLVSVMGAKLWTGKSVEINGRAYINQRDSGTVPEVFDSVSGRYLEVLLDSSKSGTVFFDWRNSTEIKASRHTATVWILFAINLTTLYPSETIRADEHAHGDVLELLRKSGEFEPQRLVAGLEAFKEYTAYDKKEQDMQPFHLFRVECKVNYNYQNC